MCLLGISLKLCNTIVVCCVLWTSWTLLRKNSASNCVNNTMRNFLRVFVWWYYHVLNFLLRVSFKYLLWRCSLSIFMTHVNNVQAGGKKQSWRQSFLGRKFPLVEIFPEFWPLICSLKACIIYLFRTSWTQFFVIQLCLQYWTKYKFVRKKKCTFNDTHREKLVLYWIQYKNSLKYKVDRFWCFSYV